LIFSYLFENEPEFTYIRKELSNARFSLVWIYV